jgi:hypothetical protein
VNTCLMPPRKQMSPLERLDHLHDSDTRQYALGRSEEAHKRRVEQHIIACSACLLKLRIALRHPG